MRFDALVINLGDPKFICSHAVSDCLETLVGSVIVTKVRLLFSTFIWYFSHYINIRLRSQSCHAEKDRCVKIRL